ncbi:hypothetical protein NKG94_51615 [Micromonospora sp. M12]
MGYRLTVTSADDEQIDEFIRGARLNAGPEQGATCSGGITATGTSPRELPSRASSSDEQSSDTPPPQPDPPRRRWWPLAGAALLVFVLGLAVGCSPRP